MNSRNYAMALLDNGYAESTSMAYSNAILKVERALSTVVYGADINSVAAVVVKLDKNGSHEALGNQGHRTVVNAVKKYLELILDEEYVPAPVAAPAPVEENEPEEEEDAAGTKYEADYKEFLRAVRNYCGYRLKDVSEMLSHYDNKCDQYVEYYMLMSIRESRNVWAHDPTLDTLTPEELDVLEIGRLYMNIISRRLNKDE